MNPFRLCLLLFGIGFLCPWMSTPSIAQEQLLPPVDWSYRMEGAASIHVATAANGFTYLIGHQKATATAYTTSYTTYKKAINTVAKQLSLEQGKTGQVFVQCLDGGGQAVWRSTWSGTADKNGFTVQAMAVDKQNNLHLMGKFVGRVDFNPYSDNSLLEKTEKGEHRVYLLQLDPTGNVLAVQSYKPDLLHPKGDILSIALDQYQSYLYVLQSNGFYSKLTTTGELVWSKKVLGDNHYEDFTLEASDIAVDAQNNLYVLRYSDYHQEEGEHDENAFAVPSSILKIASTGDKIWESAVHTNSPTSFVVDQQGQIYWWSALQNTRWTGTEQRFDVYLQSTLLLGKIDAQGQQLWQKRFLAEDWTAASDLALINGEELYATACRKDYHKIFGESIATPPAPLKAHSKILYNFDLEGQERWSYAFENDLVEQDQLHLDYDASTKKLLLWGHLAPTSNLETSSQRLFLAGKSETAQLFQWSPVLPRP